MKKTIFNKRNPYTFRLQLKQLMIMVKHLLLIISVLTGMAMISCNDDCEHTGEVTLTFERVPPYGADINMVFYAIDGETTPIKHELLGHQMSYQTTLNVGNYKVNVYAKGVFNKEVGFQIVPGKNVEITFNGSYDPTTTYRE